MKTKIIKHVFFIASLLLILNIHAQDSSKKGNISGVIVDDTSLPLPGAEIFLQINNRIIGATSDFDGKFIITNVPSGEQTITISYLGFKEIKLNVTVVSGKTIEIPSVLLKPEAESLGTVVVQTRSQGQVRALNVQKNSENIVNVISLEQASKFPDSNIGDALKRVSGLTIKTDQGEAREVSVRGLGSAATTMLINGDRISSTSFNSRSVEADLIPADVIQNIEVTKSASADLDGEATGGVVNLITRNAYSKELKLSVSTDYNYTPTWNDINYNTAVGVSKKMLDGKLGIALNGSSSSRSFKSDNIEADWDWLDTGVIGDPTDDTRFFNELQIRQYWVIRDRKNLNLGVDYEFSKNSLIGIKTSLSYRNDFENRYRTRYSSIDVPKSFTPEGIVVSEGSITTYTRAGSSEGKPNNYRLDKKNVINTKLYGEHLLGKIETDWSFTYSKSKKRRKRREIAYRVAEGEADLFVDTRNPNRPKITTNLANFNEEAVLSSFTRNTQNIDDSNIKGAIKFKIPFKNGYLKSGFQYRKNERIEDNRTFDISPIVNIDDFIQIPSENYRRSDFAFSNYQMLDAPDRAFVGGLNIFDDTLFTIVENLENHAETSYTSVEKVSAGYLQAKYNLTNDISIRGGVRWERTNSGYKAFIFDQLNQSDIDNRLNVVYDNYLPSADLKYNITRRLITRLAYSKTINRPSYSRIAPRIRFGSSDIDDDSDIGRLTVGNPNLRPRTSDNYDFSIEYYIPKGLISVGLFYKDLNNFYSRVNRNYTLANGDILQIRKTENVGDATIKGMEFAFQKNLDFLPSFLRNLNFYGNATIIDAGLIITNSNFSGFNSPNFRNKRNLTDTADFTYNASLSYEYKNFTLTGSINGTSAYILGYGPTPIQDEYYDKQTFLDFNASYDILKDLKIYFEAKNLTNQPLRYYIGESQYMIQEEYYDSQFVLGLKYKI
ncbi:TonB-dependent receptor [Formosa sp. Hel1_33_131]|uniref:TonB-dependent receptor n=1 Tax=Formosa sp. Hel1_33_131 TaxID=1336794 RepID=UPI00084E246E|nr:TonB-dependent receptor [Formosa sp. Hel1_33_131]AOR29654.1 TonB-dependent receptor [Formosa sp. Hel1_33_131]